MCVLGAALVFIFLLSPSIHETTTHATLDPLDDLLAGNRHYVQRTTAKDPNTFVELAKGQAPDILWIGKICPCANNMRDIHSSHI
jgi:hypothetical protein